MRRSLRIAGVVAGLTVVLVVAAIIVAMPMVRAKYGGGGRLEDRSGRPLVSPAETEVVADLDYPHGNIAVSASGRVFFTFHPDGDPPVQLNELVGVTPVPWPDAAFQETHFWTRAPHFQSLLAVRIDQKDRLWVLDHAHYGRGQPRLLAFDINTKEIVQRYDFPPAVAGFLSMLNDFQVDPEGRKIYIAETSPIRQTPALIVYDVDTQTSRRLLEGHPSLQPQDYVIQAPMRDMILFGVYTLRIGVDSIALDKHGTWLYYGPVNGDRLYRVATKDLNDPSLTPAELAARVENYGPKTISDGLTMDLLDNVYITDPEHSAILALGPDRQLRTIVKDSPFRWPDGLSFGPDGWLYVSCSALHQVLLKSAASVRAHAPYQIMRFKPGALGVPGQ